MERAHSFDHFSFDRGGIIPPPERLRKVLIVGAGVAGLQAARQMLKLGAQVLILEANDEIGGVWIRNYIGFGLQVPWRMYQFPEFPWPKDLQPASEYPTGQEVQEYVRAYCRAYNLRRYIYFNCKLLRLRWCNSHRQWDALYCDTLLEKFFKVTVDYAIVCTGIYSQPYIPDYEGTDSYAGIQLHAKDFVDLSLARGRRVVIVGAGKTALDCVSSIISTNTATSVTLLYRQAHWPLPRRMLGVSVRRLLFNRAMTAMMPPYYTARSTTLAASKAISPLKKLFWRSMESLISRKFRITEQMRPRVHLPADLFYGGQILDNTMDKLVRNEALLTIKGEINRFVRNGVILQDGNFVAADLVLYCTGYLKTYDYLEGEMRSRLDLQKDGLYLYRNCLPYAVPHLAFIGSEVSTYNNILTQGLQALWLAHVLGGRIQLPSPAAITEDIRAQQRWRRAVMPAQRSRGSVLMLYMMQYHDQLLADMGQPPHRKGFNLFAECFGAYTAADYEDLLSEDHTVLAARLVEEQLAAAGVPPAVLTATASGRSGTMAGTATLPQPRSPRGGAAAPAGSSGAEHRAGGSTGVATGPALLCSGSTAAAVTGSLHIPAAINPLLDERSFCCSSREGTSASVRSCNGQDHQSEPGPTAAAAAPAPAAAAAAASSAAGSAVPSYGVAQETSLKAAAPALLYPTSMDVAASTGRLSQVDWNTDSMDSRRAVRLPAATVSGSGGVAATSAAAATVAAGNASSQRAAAVWSGNEEQRLSLRAISMRVSADMVAADRWRDLGGSGNLCLEGGYIISRRPVTATPLLPVKGKFPRVAAAATTTADPSDSDGRPAAPGVVALSAPGRRLETSPQPHGKKGGGARGVGCGIWIGSESAAAPQAEGAERLTLGPAAGRRSFTARGQREPGGCVPPALSLSGGILTSGSTAAAPGNAAGYPAPNSPSRLSRYTGPTSPIPCHSTHTNASRPAARHIFKGDSWGPAAQQPSSIQCHTSQHVKCSPQSSNEAVELANSADSSTASGVGLRVNRARAKQVRSSYCVRSAPANTPSAAALSSGGGEGDGRGCESGSLLRDGSSEGSGASRDSGEEDCYQSPPSGQQQQSQAQHDATAPSLCYFEPPPPPPPPLAVATAAVQGSHVESPTGQSSIRNPCLSPGHPRAGELRLSVSEGLQRGAPSGGGYGGGCGLRTDEREGLSTAPQAEVSAIDTGGVGVGGGDDRRVDSAVRVVRTSGENGVATGVEGITGSRSQMAGIVNSLQVKHITRDCNPNKNKHSNNNKISHLAVESSSDRSRRMSSCSRSDSSSDSNASCGCSSTSVIDTGVVLVTGEGDAGATDSAAEKVNPENEKPGVPLVVADNLAAIAAAVALPVPSGTPVWHASIGDGRHLMGSSLGNASEGGLYGSPGSSAVSLSLWHANPVAPNGGGGFVRPGHGAATRAAAFVESRFSAMGRLVEVEQSGGSQGETAEEMEVSGAAPTSAEGEAEVAAVAAAAAAAAANPVPGTTAGRGVGGGGSGGGSAAAVGIALSRHGSGSDGKSPPRHASTAGSFQSMAGTANGVVGGLPWRRASSLARSPDGLTATPEEGITSTGGSWHMLHGVPYTIAGMRSAGSSSAGQTHSSISFGGGLMAAGGAGGPTQAAVPELFVRQPSRLSSCPTGDSLMGAMLDPCNYNETEAPTMPAGGGGEY
ncbi:hypothetical protein VaNZ11_001372 [Volvox africanus]|uniref:Flavin-containing monooxygenase n=1 Tax=Volvox africanus TaxID=51714 RepID=A0ABQ5RPK1_9CHLO|nr:hypothetical protein VaNZ11_001372 [Volvox africanus]